MIVPLSSLIFYIITRYIYKNKFESDLIKIEEFDEENTILNIYSKVYKNTNSQHLLFHLKYLQNYTRVNKSVHVLNNEKLLITGFFGTILTLILYYGFDIYAFYLSLVFLCLYIIFSLIIWKKVPYQNNSTALNKTQKKLIHLSPLITTLSIIGIILELAFLFFKDNKEEDLK